MHFLTWILSLLISFPTSEPNLTQAEINETVAVHNKWRAKVNVPPLVWDDDLAKTALKWAKQLKKEGCAFKHSGVSGLGENLFMATTGYYGPKEVIDAWETVINFPNVRKDVDFLQSYSKALNDVDLSGLNIESRVKDWIQNSHLKCKTCPTGSDPFLDEILDNIYDFKAYLSKSGALDVINDIGKSTKGAEGANWVMKFVKTKGISPTAFEEIITNGRKFTADIVEGAGATVKYFECKSWESSMKGLFTSGNTNFGAQFTNYLHNVNISNLNQFGYHFNPAKWTPNVSELNSALKASSNLFKTDISNWAKYRQLFGAEVDNIVRGDVDGLIDIITNSHFSKIVNPN